MKRIRSTALASALCLAALPFAAGCSDDRGAEAAEAPVAAVASRGPSADRISALGWLEPEHGLIRIAGPSGEDSVIGDLLVDQGDALEAGQLIAVLDSVEERRARIERLQAELAGTLRQLERYRNLNTKAAASDALLDEWETRASIQKAELHEAQAAFERAHVKSPIAGRIISVHAREGERIGAEGIVEVGRTDRMFAIAEVYETDAGRVRKGQRATVISPALGAPLSGSVDWVHLRVAKQDTLGTDPAARKDARVVEVEIRLDESEPAARFTNLQVEIEIEP